MKVFISWSGDLSRKIAEAIREWLPGVLQAVKPFFTPNDIEKGARWASDIASELKASAVGIFVITSENLEKPWIMFEAGAISREMDTSKICVLMFGVESTDLKGPLTQFQATRFEKSDFRKLIVNINGSLGDAKLESLVLDEVFEIWWPRLSEKLNKILESHTRTSAPKASRDQRDILEEVLILARSIQKEVSSSDKSSLSAAPLRFENTMYASIIDTLKTICINISFDNEALDVAQPAIAELIEIVSARNTSRQVKSPIIATLRSISDALAREREGNNSD